MPMMFPLCGSNGEEEVKRFAMLSAHVSNFSCSKVQEVSKFRVRSSFLGGDAQAKCDVIEQLKKYKVLLVRHTATEELADPTALHARELVGPDLSQPGGAL